MTTKCFVRLVFTVAITLGAGFPALASAQPLTTEMAPSTDSAPRLLKASLANAAATQTLTKAEWQQQYDLATARKNAGKKKLLLGVLGEGVGLVLIYAGIGTCDFSDLDCGGSSALTALGVASALGGAGLAVWGWVEYADGRGDMESLERRQPANSVVSDGLRFKLGRRTTVSYRLSW